MAADPNPPTNAHRYLIIRPDGRVFYPERMRDQAFTWGRDDRMNGAKRDTCPFRDPALAERWLEGWEECDQRLAQAAADA